MKEKGKRTQMIFSIRNERGDTATDPTDVKRITKKNTMNNSMPTHLISYMK